jgi:hypothetical protein
LAAVLDADVLSGAILVIGAAADADAASAGLAVGALLSSDAGQLALAGQAFLAILELAATDLGRRIGLVPWRAGTLVGVVFNRADGGFAAHVSLANVEAGVGEPVAKLVGGAVVVFNAVDGLAAFSVRVAREQPGRASALADVISCHANCGRAAAKSAARRHARSLISGNSAHFRLLALSIVGASLDRRHTACSAVGGSGKSEVALAKALVVVSDADGVGRADDSVADVDAGSSPENAFSADFAGTALGVAGAAGDDLANAGQLVLGVAFFAGAQWPAVDDLALFGVRARHDLAGVEAGTSSVDVDLADKAFGAVGALPAFLFRKASFLQVRRVAGKSVVADASHVVVVRHAEGVGSARGSAAGIDAPSGDAVLVDGAHLVVAAVSVVGALRDGGAADGRIVRVVTLESWSAQALAKVAHGVGATLHRIAEVVEFFFGLCRAHFKWISHKVELAATVVAPGDVDADRVDAADVG